MSKMENLSQVEEIIRYLEIFKKGGIRDGGAMNAIDGYNLALRIIRTMSLVANVNDQADRLLIAFEDWAHTQREMRTINVTRCSSCEKSHGDTRMIREPNTPNGYWAICPELLVPFYVYPNE